MGLVGGGINENSMELNNLISIHMEQVGTRKNEGVKRQQTCRCFIIENFHNSFPFRNQTTSLPV